MIETNLEVHKMSRDTFEIFYSKDRYLSPIQFHSHDFYEIYFFLNGHVTYYIEEECYHFNKGDLLIIPPGKMHRPLIEPDKVYERFVVWLDSRYVANTKNLHMLFDEIVAQVEQKNTRLLSFTQVEYKTLYSLFESLSILDGAHGEANFIACEGYLTLILHRVLTGFSSLSAVEVENEETIQQVIAYINQHLTADLTLDALASHFYCSKYHLLHLFKERTNTTIHQYILSKKVILAKELLLKNHTPKAVSEQCGFSNYSNFYKVFTAAVGLSPKQYKLWYFDKKGT